MRAVIKPPSPEAITEAAECIRRGELVGFPTETVYGLGANAENAEAVLGIFAAKNRPANNPLIVHVASADAVSTVALLDSPLVLERFSLLRHLWPGPLSLVLPRRKSIPLEVTAGLETVAVRVPAHPVAHALLTAAQLPIAAPSANPSNYVSPTTAQHVADELGDVVAMILDGGPCEVGIESTIISIVHTPPRLLRHGSITIEALQALLGEVVDGTVGNTELLAPGMLAEHYAPRTPLLFLDDATPELAIATAALITFRSRPDIPRFAVVRQLSVSGDHNEIARQLFATLRELDHGGFDYIAIDSCEDKGFGKAIMDRLRRATKRSQ